MKKLITANLYDVAMLDLLYFLYKDSTKYVELHREVMITCEDLNDWLEEHNIKVYFYHSGGVENEHTCFGVAIDIPNDRKDLLLYYKLRWE